MFSIILVNVWRGLPFFAISFLAGLQTIPPELYGTVQGRMADFLAERLALTIDGEPAAPVLERINFLRRTLRSSTIVDPPEELSIFTAQLGAIFIVPCQSPSAR